MIIKNSKRCDFTRKTCSDNIILLKRPRLNPNDGELVRNRKKHHWWNNTRDMLYISPQNFKF